MHEWWRRIRTRAMAWLRELRTDGRSALMWSLRITVAATASYVVATLLFPGTKPLLAPLTAMLVVQVTPVSLLASGLDRVVAVMTGVSLAVGFAAVVPLEWWSLGVLIFVSITIGQALRLRSNLLEVAISGMLVLGVGSVAENLAWQRITETLVGASVGIAANLLFPPKVASSDAAHAIDQLAHSMSDQLNRAADELTDLVANGGEVAPAAWNWLDEIRRIAHYVPSVGAAVEHAEEGRRLNVRAVGTPNVGPGLRQGHEALEHAVLAIRGMFRALADATQDATWLEEESAPDILLGLAQTFREMAASIDAFGHLVRNEADTAQHMSPADVYALQQALEGLHEAQARLDDLLMSGIPPELVELHAIVLSTVKRLLREMNLDERVRRQVRLQRLSRSRRRRPRVPARGRRPPEPPESTPEAETQVLPPVPSDRRD